MEYSRWYASVTANAVKRGLNFNVQGPGVRPVACAMWPESKVEISIKSKYSSTLRAQHLTWFILAFATSSLSILDLYTEYGETAILDPAEDQQRIGTLHKMVPQIELVQLDRNSPLASNVSSKIRSRYKLEVTSRLNLRRREQRMRTTLVICA